MRFFLYYVFLWALFGFKFKLIPVLEIGLRLDDFLIALSAILVFYYFIHARYRKLIPIPLTLYWLYSAFAVASSLIAFSSDRVPLIESLLYALRGTEYTAYFFIGYYLSKFKQNFTKEIKIYVAYALVLVVFQNSGFVGVVSRFSGERAIANTGGPWELAAVSAFCSLYLLKERSLFSLPSLMIIILTQSRITAVAMILTGSKFFYDYAKNQLVSAIFLLVVTMLVASFGYSNFAVTERIDSMNSSVAMQNADMLNGIARPMLNRNAYITEAYYDSLAWIHSLPGDHSANIRLYRWQILFKSIFSSVETILWGLGPGFAWVAVDGNYIRLLIENGILGSLVFTVFLLSLFITEKDRVLRLYIVVLAITALTVDIFVTFKAMMLLWFYYGHLCGQRAHRYEAGKRMEATREVRI